MPDGILQAERDGSRLVLSASGAWTLASASTLLARIETVGNTGGLRQASLDTAKLSRLDTAGAVLLHRLEKQLARHGVRLERAALKPEHQALMDYVTSCDASVPMRPAAGSGLVGLITYFGWLTVFFGREALRFTAFIGEVTLTMLRLGLQPRRLRLTSVVHHMEQVGLRAIPIVGLLSFLIGMVMAYQGASQLQRFGAQIFVVDLISISVLRELGVLLTAILIAGRSGSAFTAQIGTMKVNEEISALRTLGLDPIEVLVLPRMLALLLTLPVLGFFADIMGLVGGALMAWNNLDIDPFLFFRRLHEGNALRHFTLGIVKAPVFAILIALVGCYEGLRVKHDAESVGRLTTRAVVQSIFLVIVFDALFSIVFSLLGL